MLLKEEMVHKPGIKKEKYDPPRIIEEHKIVTFADDEPTNPISALDPFFGICCE